MQSITTGTVAAATLSVFTDPQVNGRTINAANGEVIYQPGVAAENVFYIHRGQVRLYMVGADESCRLIEILGPGEWFGAAALAGAKNYETRAVAVAGAVLTEARADRIMQVLANSPSQHVELTRQLAAKLLASHIEASRLVFEDCNSRLINALLRFSNSAASTQREDGVVLRITHDQLAQAVGVARETVSLALTQLRQQNLLRTGRNQLVFNPETLKQFTARNVNGNGNGNGNGHATEVREEVAVA